MKIRKLLSITLAMLLTIQPIVVYASTGSLSAPRGRRPDPGGRRGNVDLSRLAGTYQNWGWRITFGDTRPIVESNIQPLEEGYSDSDLLAKRDEMINIANKRYWGAGQHYLDWNFL